MGSRQGAVFSLTSVAAADAVALVAVAAAVGVLVRRGACSLAVTSAPALRARSLGLTSRPLLAPLRPRGGVVCHSSDDLGCRRGCPVCFVGCTQRQLRDALDAPVPDRQSCRKSSGARVALTNVSMIHCNFWMAWKRAIPRLVEITCSEITRHGKFHPNLDDRSLPLNCSMSRFFARQKQKMHVCEARSECALR